MAKKMANMCFKRLEEVDADFPTLMGGVGETVDGSRPAKVGRDRKLAPPGSARGCFECFYKTTTDESHVDKTFSTKSAPEMVASSSITSSREGGLGLGSQDSSSGN